MQIRIEIANKNEQYTISDLEGVVELGRESTASDPAVQHCQIRDPYVSKHHLRIEEIKNTSRVVIENISKRASIEVSILGKGFLAVGQRCSLDLPVQLKVGQFSRIQITSDDDSPDDLGAGSATEIASAEDEDLTQVAAPQASAIDPTNVVRLFEDLDKAQTMVARTHEGARPTGGSKVASEEVVRWLQTLAGVNRSSINAAQFFNRSARAMVDLFGMDFGLVLRRRPGSWQRLASHPHADAAYSETVLREVMAKRSTYIKTDRFDMAQSLADLESAVASPIFGEDGQVVAVLYAARQRKQGTSPRPISALEARLVQVLATAVGAGLSGLESRARLERMETEMDLARRIQASFFPRAMPSIAAYELFGKAQPAEAVGGDYFDVVELPDGRFGLVIADVCGHGVGPSLLMASLRATLRGLARKSVDAAETMSVLNDMLYDELHAQRKFVTLLFGILDPSRHRFEYANAGHGPVVLHFSSERQRFRLLHEDDQKNVPVGMLEGVEYKLCEPVELKPGDSILLGSDGIVEINESFGMDQLEQLIRELSHSPIEQLVEQLIQTPLELPGRRRDDDDMTLLVTRRKGRNDE